MIHGNYEPDTGLNEINFVKWEPVCYTDRVYPNSGDWHCLFRQLNTEKIILGVGIYNPMTRSQYVHQVKYFGEEEQLEAFLGEWI